MVSCCQILYYQESNSYTYYRQFVIFLYMQGWRRVSLVLRFITATPANPVRAPRRKASPYRISMP